MLGILGAMAPNKKGVVAKIIVRAMITGNVACFMTACTAGEYSCGAKCSFLIKSICVFDVQCLPCFHRNIPVVI